MNFNIVLGNPPYTKNIDIDFVTLGYEISSDFCTMITPAKWQTASDGHHTAGDESYGKLHKEIVPHIKKVVYYPDCLDVFCISQADGVTYTLIDKHNTYENICTVVNKCNLNRFMNSIAIRDITHQQSLWNIGNEIVNYLGNYTRYKILPIVKRGKHTVNINTQVTDSRSASGAWDFSNSCLKKEFVGKGGALFNQSGQLVVISKTRILEGEETSPSSTSQDMFTSDSIEECNSFSSWIDTKFTRFFILINISKRYIINNDGLRLVPAPPKDSNGLEYTNPEYKGWNHLYTDEELYKYYKLPQKYIDVIEGTIRERKDKNI